MRRPLATKAVFVLKVPALLPVDGGHSREAAFIRKDDPDGLGGGGQPRPHRVTVIKCTGSWSIGALPAANLGQLSQFVFVDLKSLLK